jgi:leucyl aminopeptidase
VGKGVTFDSGGLNLKPSNSIETMRTDMAGAAAVLGAMQTLAALKAPINVIGVCPAVCNAIDGASYFPGDIYSACDGTTVEICNTDAEGRLALGDAIAFARKKYELSEIIDIATLTGGVLTTFSTLLGGLFANDDALAAALFEAGEQTHERLWRLPLYEEYSETMKGDRSVLRNLSTMKRGYASSITGAAFIKHFVGTTPWAHLDIAGTAYNEGEARAELPKQATGYGVRLLVHYLLQRG